jgi:hypothetical protein
MPVRQFSQNLLRLVEGKLPVNPFNCLIKLKNTLCSNAKTAEELKKATLSHTYVITSQNTIGFAISHSCTQKFRCEKHQSYDPGLTIIIIIITMAQQPYMGSGLLLPPLSEVTKSCAFVAVGDRPTGRATIISILMCPPEPSEKWRL